MMSDERVEAMREALGLRSGDIILICSTVADLPNPLEGSQKMRCESCLTPVWVSSITVLRAFDDYPTARQRLLCGACGLKLAAGSAEDVEWNLTMNQEWMRPLLPQGRIKRRRRR